jgi:hypothetical protein
MKEQKTDFSIQSTSYPDYKFGQDDHIHYYAEFNRGWKEDNFTIFQRGFITSKEDWEKMMATEKDSFAMQIMSREGHPFQLFDGFCKEGCFPSPEWVKWMVDALNEKANRDKNEQTVWKPRD